MRVLMGADTLGGVWTYALELGRELARLGIGVDLVTFGARPDREQRNEAQRIDALTLHETDLRVEWMRDPWEDVRRAGELLLELEERVRPDVVHLNDYSHGALPFTAPVLVVGHSCVLSWWRAVRGGQAPAEWSVYRERVRAGLQGADLVVAPSQWMLSALVEHYGKPRRARVIHNGRAAHTSVVPMARREIVLAAGRVWDEAKNIALLARAAPLMPWPVHVAGPGAVEGPERELENVHRLGLLSQRELARWYERAAVFAAPARYEPFGLAILEAAQHGCALVLGDIESLREVWDDAASFHACDDHEALAAAVRTLADHPLRRARAAAAARARAKSYTRARFGQAYAQTYRELVHSGRSGRTELLAEGVG
jgi:glycogen(starch) synthase